MSAAASRATIIGRSMHDIAAVWSRLQPFFHGADLIMTLDPAGRALEAPATSTAAVFVIVDRQSDIDELELLDVAPDWLLVLCPPDLMQISLAELKPLTVPVLSLEAAGLAVLGTAPFVTRHRQPSSRERL